MAPTDPGVFVADLWKASMQNSLNVNEPDYFDAIETIAHVREADASTMETLYAGFAEARYFVGDNDDGEHIPDAGDFTNAEVAVSVRHSVLDLPLLEQQPPLAEQPAPYGSNVIVVSLEAGTTRPLRVAFDGDDGTRWAARVLLTGVGEASASHALTLDATTQYGSVLVDPTGHDELVLVVANLGTADYDPDSPSGGAGSYYYSIEPVIDPPVVTAVFPGAVLRGRYNLHLRLVGENFLYGSEFGIRFGNPAILVQSIDSVTATEVLFTISVPLGTATGETSMTLVNGGGQETTADALVTVVDALDDTEPPARPGGCRTGGTPTPVAILLVTLLLAVIRRRRF